jgi:hypothetical protein
MRMTLYFGEAWDAPVFDGGQVRQVETPVGEACMYCFEPVADGDRGYMEVAVARVEGGHRMSHRPLHRECQLCSVLGNFAHVQGLCQYVGHCEKLLAESGRTLRQDALAAWAWVHSMHAARLN